MGCDGAIITYIEYVIFHAKTAEPIELPFGTVSGVGQSNSVLSVRAYWYHLTNTVERLRAAARSGSAHRGGDAACSQMSLGNIVSTGNLNFCNFDVFITGCSGF